MINPNDFKLGNYLQDTLRKLPIMVIALTSDSITFDGQIFEEQWQAEPIPISEQWLLDFGFIDRSKPLNNGMSLGIIILGKMEIAWYKQDNRVRFQTIENGFILKYIIYVHELQNLYFSLTGNHLQLVRQTNG